MVDIFNIKSIALRLYQVIPPTQAIPLSVCACDMRVAGVWTQ